MSFWTGSIIYIVLTMLPFLSFVMAPSPKPIRGIYQQRGRTYVFKYVAFWLLVSLRSLLNKLGLKRNKEGKQSSGYGAKSSSKIDELDGVHELPKEFSQAIDAVYFVGVNQDGFGMLASAARRHKGLVQSAFELIVPNVGVLLRPDMPDTSINVKPDDETGHWHCGGLEIDLVEAGRKWHLRRNGQMRLYPVGFKGAASTKDKDTAKLVNVSFEAVWESTSRIFDTDSDIHPHVLSDAVAREQWSREMFETLEKQHQTHLEQFGEVKATITIEGYGTFNPRIQVLRDHSFGHFRDWNEFHRYAIFYLFCEDGSGLNVTTVSRPITMSRLAFGYRVYPDGSLRPVPHTDLDLSKVTEDYSVKAGFSFKAHGGGRAPFLFPEEFNVRITEVFAAPAFYIGHDRDAQITDVFLKGTINGKPCWGISEWMQGYEGEGSSRKALYTRQEDDE